MVLKTEVAWGWLQINEKTNSTACLVCSPCRGASEQSVLIPRQIYQVCLYLAMLHHWLLSLVRSLLDKRASYWIVIGGDSYEPPATWQYICKPDRNSKLKRRLLDYYYVVVSFAADIYSLQLGKRSFYERRISVFDVER